jgi:16S rRNA (adenine1518-N6/adenine1519-N6)-dimethyltransferase
MSNNFPFSVRKLLALEGITPNRRMGQHFLVDRGLLERIAAHAQGRPTLEIGAGPGNLTHFLASQAERVVAIEADRRLLPILSRVVGGCQNVRIAEGDFLAWKVSELLGGSDVWVCISNLPYSSSSPMLFRLVDEIDRFAEIFVSLQLEVAERLTASAGSRSYGRLSVMVGLVAEAAILFRIRRQAFYPRPEVESAFVRLRPHRRHRDRLRSSSAFSCLIRAAFSQRRKQIRNALRSAYGRPAEGEWLEEALGSARIDPTVRPEQVSVEQYVDLANALSDLKLTDPSSSED